MKGVAYMATTSINFRFGRIIVLLRKLTRSTAETSEVLYLEASSILPTALSKKISTLLDNPIKYEEDFEFLDEIIQDLKAEL